VPVISLSLLALVAGFFALIFFAVFNMLKTSEPAKDALAKALANRQVQSELGAPIQEGLIVSGNISTTGASGRANLDIPISGPKGKGRIYVEGSKSGGTWTYSTLEVAIDGKPNRIDLKP
jgi:hypothetical protein